MPDAVPGDVCPHARRVVQDFAGRCLGEIGVSQTHLFGPDQDIMGQEHKAQEGEDGVELPGAHGLDIEDMPGLGQKGFKGGAFNVESM